MTDLSSEFCDLFHSFLLENGFSTTCKTFEVECKRNKVELSTKGVKRMNFFDVCEKFCSILDSTKENQLFSKGTERASSKAEVDDGQDDIPSLRERLALRGESENTSKPFDTLTQNDDKLHRDVVEDDDGLESTECNNSKHNGPFSDYIIPSCYDYEYNPNVTFCSRSNNIIDTVMRKCLNTSKGRRSNRMGQISAEQKIVEHTLSRTAVVEKLRGHEDVIVNLEFFSNDNTYLFSASLDNKFRIWNASHPMASRSSVIHGPSDLMKATLDPSSGLIACCTYNSEMRIYDVTTKELALSIPCRDFQDSTQFHSIAIGKQGNTNIIVAGGSCGRVVAYDTRSRKCIGRYSMGSDTIVGDICWGQSEMNVYCSADTVSRIDLRSSILQQNYSVGSGIADSLAFFPGQGLLFGASRSNGLSTNDYIQKWNEKSGNAVLRLESHTNPIVDEEKYPINAGFLFQDKFCIVPSKRNSLVVYDTDSGRVTSTLRSSWKNGGNEIVRVATNDMFSMSSAISDEAFIATGMESGEIALWAIDEVKSTQLEASEKAREKWLQS